MRIFKSIITAWARTISSSPCALYRLSIFNQWELNDQRNEQEWERGRDEEGKAKPKLLERGIRENLALLWTHPSHWSEGPRWAEQTANSNSQQSIPSAQFPEPSFQCLLPFWWNHHLHLIMLFIKGSWKAIEIGECNPIISTQRNKKI